ncbi:MAG: efflux RND transporter periplasmic adaptor subunit [Bacteroidota bacterium]
MKINIKRKDIIKGAALIAGGILIGALLFSASGDKNGDKQIEVAEEHAHDEQSEGETTWTCSMHPQVRQDEPGDCPICGMELIPADELDEDEASQSPDEFRMTETAMKLANIQTSTVKKEKPEKEILLTGKINIDERLINTQAVHFPGRIEELYLNFKGEYVSEGQTIASVYSPELIAAQKELFEALKTDESNPKLLEAAKSKLRQWKLTESQIQQIIENGEVKEELDVKSNTSGIVHKKLVNKGDYVKKGAMLYHIARIDKVWVMFDAYQEDLQFIEKGDKIKFTVSSIPGKAFESKVTFIDPVMNSKSRVAEIRTEAQNHDDKLKPGMFAEGTLKSDNISSEKELVVPKSSVMWTGRRSVVYVKQPDREQPTYRMREVTLGANLGDQYIIKEGLELDEEIVTYGTFAVDAAAQLGGKPSMMNPEGGKTSTGHDHGDMEEGQEMDQASESKSKKGKELKWPKSEAQQYKSMVESYLLLKDNLVNDEKADEFAGELVSSISDVDMGAFSEKGHMKWMEYQKVLKEKAQKIQEAKKLGEQRKHFIQLSDNMIELVKTFEAPETDSGSSLYVQFCPMANDDKGAFWLSKEDEVKNPYYGDMMLTCGEVREEIE